MSDLQQSVPITEEAPPAATPLEPATAVPAASPSGGLTPPVLLVSLLLPLLLAFVFLRRGKATGRKLIICGPVGAGKSAIYHRLRFGRVVPTVSSMQPTSASFVPSGSTAAGARPTFIIDMPGTGRLRSTLLEEASSATALVCVIDGTQLAAQARDAAGMLFEVLSHDPVARNAPPVMIAVNKQDCAGAASSAVARKAIEQEVERVRLARTTMEDTSGRAKQQRGIADDSQGAFSFDHLDNKVTFAATSATKPQLDKVLELIGQLG